jgi:tRNA (cytidine/uridine-2'-O-)-methyltransferase
MLHIVLFEPEIPENTGNIARTCVGFNATLHLIRPYGFYLNDKKLKRSGLDYWKHLKLIEHDNYADFMKTIDLNSKIYYVTKYGVNQPNHIKYSATNDTYFIFGKETKGLPKEILSKNRDLTIYIPITKNIRSLNLSNCVAIISYEYIIKENRNASLISGD